MPLSFQAACLPVAQGSLPHSTVAQALGILLKTTPTILTLPQLVRRNLREWSYVRSGLGFPGLMVDQRTERVYVDRGRAEQGLDRLGLAYLQDDTETGMLPAEDLSAWAEVLRGVAQNFRGCALVGQMFGPVSLSLQLTDEHLRPLIYDPVLLEALTQHLMLRAAWFSSQLANYADDIIICLEEPFLDAFGSPFFPLDWDQGIELLERAFAGVSGCRGLVAGGSVNWSAVLETSVEYIVFDAYEHSATMLAAAGALAGFFERAGVLVWGLVPTDERTLAHTTAASVVAHYEGLLDALADAGIARETALQASLISTSTSLDHLPVTLAEQALCLCAEVSDLLRSKYTLEEVTGHSQ